MMGAMPPDPRDGPRLHALPRQPRLLACDIDGTLLDGAGQLRSSVRAAIGLIVESGVRVVLATGRSPWAGVADVAGGLGLTGPQITMQGALISIPASGRIQRHRALDIDVYLAAIRFAAELRVEPIVATLDGHVATVDDRWSTETRRSFAVGHAFRVVADLAEVAGDQPMRIFLPTEAAVHDAVRMAAVERFAGAAAVVWSDATGVELLAPGTSKGEAVQWLARSMGLGMADVAAVGDAPNDLEMLRAAGRSVAMAHAPADVRAAANMVVPPTGEDGIIQAFAWLFPELADRLGAATAREASRTVA